MANEIDASVFTPWKCVENLGIEYESAENTIETPQSMMQGSVIEAAQVAPEPDQNSRHGNFLG